jgi:histidinol dehydrogenase
MNIIRFPELSQADSLLARPSDNAAARRATVADMLDAIRKEGDVAVRRFATQFDGPLPDNLTVTPQEFKDAENKLPEPLKAAIRQACINIRSFHAAQLEPSREVETMPGVKCWRKSVPIDRVGLYIPGGSAPLFSTVLMLGVPARLAGCKDIVLCTPPQSDGSVHPAVLFAAGLCDIRRIFKLGAVQAIGAMAYGTETVPAVWKIFGPGNPWVTTAKQLVSLDGVAIDLPAGPSEVAVLADKTADARFVAADLLSQAEHGPDSQVLLVSDHEPLLLEVIRETERQLTTLPRQEIARQALHNSRALLVSDLDTGMHWINAYAPEHLILQVAEPARLAGAVRNAGSVFLGHFTPESAGDYASGTNHTLPTGGHARATGGVSLDSFFKKITFQEITRSGLEKLDPVVTTMARAEGLEAHALAVEIRLSNASHG